MPDTTPHSEGPVDYVSRKQVPELIDALMLKLIDQRPEDPRAFFAALLSGGAPPVEGAGKVDIYLARVSVGCHAPLLVLRLAGIEHEIHDIDLMKGEQMTPEFLAINPTHTVPAIRDNNGDCVWDSVSIMRHLCGKFLTARKYYPAQHSLRAHCDMALEWRHTKLYPAVADAVYPALGFAEAVGDSQTKAIDSLTKPKDGHFTLLADFFLNGKTFICGEDLTIADISVFTSLVLLEGLPEVVLPPVLQAYKDACWAACSYDVCLFM